MKNELLNKYLAEDMLDEEEINAIQERRRFTVARQDDANTATPIWKDFDRSKSLLASGIHVVKYNYHNMGSKDIVLRLSPDARSLTYEPSKEPKGVLAKLTRRTRTIALENFVSFVYGG